MARDDSNIKIGGSKKTKKQDQSIDSFKQFFDQTIDAILVIQDRNIIYSNRSVEKLFGFSQAEIISRPVLEFISEAARGKATERYNRRMAGEDLSPLFETEVVCKDGSIRPVEISSCPIEYEGEKAFVLIVRDISDRKTIEKALIQSEEKYRLLFENAEEAIFLVGEDGIFRMMNKKAAKYLGGQPEDFIGKKMKDLFPPEIARRQMKSIRKVLKSNRGAVIQSETILNQVERTFRTSIIPLADGHESKGIAQLIAHDITELQQRQLQDEVQLELIELLRDTKNIDQCLESGCQAIFRAELFKRAVFTLHNKERQITNMGYVGIDKKLAERARNAPPPSKELARKMMRAEFRIGKSYFIPAEAGFRFQSTPRYISQRAKSLRLEEAWRSGDELFVPVLRTKKEIAGWLSLDTPFNKLRPNIDTIQFLEQVAEKVYLKIRDIANIERIKAEHTALKEKNIALKEVLGHIEEEKMALRREVAGQIERAILPAIDKAIDNKKDSANSYMEMARKHLLNLASFSSGSAHIYSKLSRRESEICQLIKAGHTNKEMAELLAISISTIQKHRESIRRKFGLKNRSVNLAVFLQKLDYL